MSVEKQLRWGGVVAVVAGVLAVVAAALRGFGLAPLVGQWAAFVNIVLLFFVFITIYAVQVPGIGRIGLAGFVMALVGLGFTEVISFLILARFSGLAAAHEVQMFAWSQIPILHLAVLFNTAGAVLLGWGTVQARMLPRWTGALLIVAAALNFLNEYLAPLPALMIVPALLFGAAFIGMGWAIWTGGRTRVVPHLAS